MSEEILTKYIKIFISNLIVKYKNESLVINIILEQLKSKYLEFLICFQNNYLNLKSKKYDQLQTSKNDYIINNNSNKSIQEIDNNQNDNNNADEIKVLDIEIKNQNNKIDNQRMIYSDHFIDKVQQIFHQKIQIQQKHNFNDEFDVVFSNISYEDMDLNFITFFNANKTNEGFIMNFVLKTLFFISQTKQVQFSKDTKSQNIFYQYDNDQILNQGYYIKNNTFNREKFQIHQFVLFSNQQNLLFQKVQFRILKCCYIQLDQRLYEKSLSVKILFNIVEIPLNSYKVKAIAIKDIKKFKIFLKQNNCIESTIDKFIQMQEENPCSIQVQLPLLYYYRQILKLRVNIQLLEKNDREQLIKQAYDKYLNVVQDQNKNSKDIFSYQNFINFEFRSNPSTLTFNNIIYEDKLLRFLEHIKIQQLLYSVDPNRVTKIIEKFMNQNSTKIIGSDFKYYEESYERIFGKCKITSPLIEKNNTNLFDMKILKEEFEEMKNSNQLFIPSCFILKYDPHHPSVKLLGGFKSLKMDQTKWKLNQTTIVHQFKQIEKENKVYFNKIFKQFQINSQQSGQFSKNEINEIKEIIKSVEHINDSFICLISFFKLRPDYFQLSESEIKLNRIRQRKKSLLGKSIE